MGDATELALVINELYISSLTGWYANTETYFDKIWAHTGDEDQQGKDSLKKK